MYDTCLQATEMMIMVTQKSIVLLNDKCKLYDRYAVRDLVEIIQVKADPSFLALSFTQGIQTLILSTFRRTELMFYLLSLKQN